MSKSVISTLESDESRTASLRFLREKKGVSVAALCKKIGVKPSTVYGWESGRRKPRPDDYSRLADALELCHIEKVELFKWYVRVIR